MTCDAYSPPPLDRSRIPGRAGPLKTQPARLGFVPRNAPLRGRTANLGQFLFNRDTYPEPPRRNSIETALEISGSPAQGALSRASADSLRTNGRISAAAAGRRNDRHRTGLRRRSLDVRINVGRTQDPVGLLQLFAQGLIAGTCWMRVIPAGSQSLIIRTWFRITRLRHGVLRRGVRRRLTILRGARHHHSGEQHGGHNVTESIKHLAFLK